jgi:hypothetical protein
MDINLNQRATVTLTEVGRNIWLASPYSTAHITQGGQLRTELWELMHVFGPHMFNGCDMPFTTTTVKLEPL